MKYERSNTHIHMNCPIAILFLFLVAILSFDLLALVRYVVGLFEWAYFDLFNPSAQKQKKKHYERANS